MSIEAIGCPIVVLQLGCEANDPWCWLRVYDVAVNGYESFRRPPGARVRVKAAGQLWDYAFVYEDNGGYYTGHYQQLGEWIEIEGLRARIVVECRRKPSTIQISPYGYPYRYRAYWWRENATFQNPEPMDAYVYNGNNCNPYEPVIVGTYDNLDGSLQYPGSEQYLELMAGEYPAGIFPSPDPGSGERSSAAFFTPTSGSRMCAGILLNGELIYKTCNRDTFAQPVPRDREEMLLSCEARAPLPEMSATIPLDIRTTSNCPYLVVQIGCQSTDYCLGYGYQGGPRNMRLEYPILSPIARVRVKVLGPGFGSATWLIDFSNVEQSASIQARGYWQDILVPAGTTYISLRAICSSQIAPDVPSPIFTAPPSQTTPPPAMTRFSKRIVNVFQYGWLPIIVTQPSLSMENLVFADPQSPQSVTLGPYSDEDITFEFIAGGPVCVYDNDGTPTCGDPTVPAHGTGRSDAIYVECSEPRPPKPDMQSTIPIRLTVVKCTIAVQIGCEQGSYCSGFAYQYADLREPDIDYPLLPTAARLRVRAFGVAVAKWEYFDSVAWQQVEQRQFEWAVIPVTIGRGVQNVRVDCSEN
jgi:hypothetical protein